ncbi:MAG: hypothetical protein AABW51_02000 [Nanoarchaeota archaeon]
MVRYEKSEDKPLSEVIEGRKNHYLSKVVSAFNSVYASGDFEYIGQFEGAVLKLSESAIEGKKLEGRVGKATPITSREPSERRVGRKPKLTAEVYVQAVKDQLTKEDLAQNYSFDGRALGPLKRHHGALKKSD